MSNRQGKIAASQTRIPLTSWSTQALVASLSVAIVVAITVIAQHFLWKYAVEEVSKDHMDAMGRDAFLMEARLRGRANDMFFLKRVVEDRSRPQPKAALPGDNLRLAVTTMMLARSQYDKIFLLDLAGREIFRCNWKDGEHPVQEVLPADFQDKSSRPFFIETLHASPESAVFSPLELTNEHNKTVTPIKPTVRISGQIAGPDGKARALLVLNYRGEQIVREIRQTFGTPGQTLLLNNDGYWLVGPTPETEWGFGLPERKGNNLRVTNPGLWTKITSLKSGWFDENGNLYCFMNLDPLDTGSDYPPIRIPVRGGERLKWTMLATVPNAVVWNDVKNIREASAGRRGRGDRPGPDDVVHCLGHQAAAAGHAGTARKPVAPARVADP